ncbi:hypothetical protein, partial [Escherichia sp. TW15838]|uniref:hypothetical protein n=1 Tax=Escherichia sp. TW15838 TaxID=910237 RepID=UPI0006806AE6
KQKNKNPPGLPAVQIVDNVRIVHAGCGVNALSGLQNSANSIYCNLLVGLISIAHQASLHLSSVSTAGVTSGDGFLTSYRQKCMRH